MSQVPEDKDMSQEMRNANFPRLVRPRTAGAPSSAT